MRIYLVFSICCLLVACQGQEKEACGEECRRIPGSKTSSPQKELSMKQPLFDLGTDSPMVCKLSTPQLQERKQTIIAELKKAMLEKVALDNGYAYKFKATDTMLDKLNDFVKTERMCCDFFTFRVTVTNKQIAWLEILGADGAKEFIETELEL